MRPEFLTAQIHVLLTGLIISFCIKIYTFFFFLQNFPIYWLLTGLTTKTIITTNRMFQELKIKKLYTS